MARQARLKKETNLSHSFIHLSAKTVIISALSENIPQNTARPSLEQCVQLCLLVCVSVYTVRQNLIKKPQKTKAKSLSPALSSPSSGWKFIAGCNYD